MKRNIPIAFLLLIALGTGCHHDSSHSVSIDETQNGQTVSLASGDSLVIELAGNPTTGYEWAVAQADDDLLRLADSSYTPDSPGLAGSGGLYLFRFEALRPGSAPLLLAYRRPWEPNAPARSFALTVSIPE